jgi:hypothetical protein
MLFVVLPNGEFKIQNYSQFAKHLRFTKVLNMVAILRGG